MKKEMKPIREDHNAEDEWLYIETYMYLKGFADAMGYKLMALALPRAVHFHKGQYRNGLTTVNDKQVHLPYVLHALKVCETLVSVRKEISFLSHEQFDILFASALLHDVIEDYDGFKKGGLELVEDYGFPMEVYNLIKLVSKFSGADEYELNIYFNNIKLNILAILIKLADRSHNVEDLYNMLVEKIRKYVKETRNYIYPLASYAKETYPELSNAIQILKSKIVSLTEEAEAFINKYEPLLAEKDKIIEEKDKEIRKLRREIRKSKDKVVK